MKKTLTVGKVETYQSYARLQIGKFKKFKDKHWELKIRELKIRSMAIGGGLSLDRYLISSRCSGFWFLKKYIPILDCDSVNNKDMALTELNRRSLHCWVFKSSQNPDKFWVIVDMLKSFKEAILLMESIPGCDRQYINMCRRSKEIVLRAFPKNGFRPYPMNGQLDYGNSPVHRWAYEFWKWWFSDMTEFFLAQQGQQLQPASPPAELLSNSDMWGISGISPIAPNGWSYVAGVSGMSGYVGVTGVSGMSGYVGITLPQSMQPQFIEKPVEKPVEKPKKKTRDIRIEDDDI